MSSCVHELEASGQRDMILDSGERVPCNQAGSRLITVLSPATTLCPGAGSSGTPVAI